MINLFTKSQKQQQLNKTYHYLDKFYRSFSEDNTFNELNIDRYRPIRDSIGFVMRKFDANDNPLAYTSKLIMYIQSQIAFNHLRLTQKQQSLMKDLSQNNKYVKLNYVYTGPIYDAKQFLLK